MSEIPPVDRWARATVIEVDVPLDRPNQSMLGLGLRLVYRMYRMHPLTAAVAVFGALLTALGIVGSTIVVGSVVDDVVIPAFADSSTIGAAQILLGIAGVLAVAILRLAGNVMRRYFAAMTTQRVERSLRERLGRYYLGLPLEFHQRAMSGRLLAHADNDTIMATGVLDAVPFSLGVIFLMVFSALSLFAVDPLIAAVALLIFPAMYGINKIYTSRVERPTALVQAGVGRVSSIAHESFDGALIVKTLGRADEESERFDTASAGLRDNRIQVGNIRAVFEAVLQSLPNLGIAIVVLIGAYRIQAGAMTSGDLVQVASLFTLLAVPMAVFGYFLEMIPRSVVSHRRLQTIWREPLPEPNVRSFVSVSPPDDTPLLRVDSVGYTYPSAERLDDDEALLSGTAVVRSVSTAPAVATLADVSFEVRSGEVVALVGSTGAGKSTLCSLLAGLVEPTTGTVSFKGQPPTALTDAERANQIALVFQESFLFADSITENIALANPDPVAVRRAAEMASADKFVGELPEGFKTVVGERGVTLSGGQRQRIALARALYRQPDLIILDDATSAVDPVIEQQILDALRTQMSITAVIVAQRLSTIQLADRVVYLDGGRVVADGTHAELLAHPGYQALVEAYEELST
ncbi:MAG: ABC transporter ATP-binding protein [Acidimicrobiales bacterium]|nr:ABC transporter ATP-binding protein [Acidimicrobiales bacterium]